MTTKENIIITESEEKELIELEQIIDNNIKLGKSNSKYSQRFGYLWDKWKKKRRLFV